MAIILLTKKEATIIHNIGIKPEILITQKGHENTYLSTDEDDQEDLETLVDCYIPHRKVKE
jgi:hypothetical protein